MLVNVFGGSRTRLVVKVLSIAISVAIAAPSSAIPIAFVVIVAMTMATAADQSIDGVLLIMDDLNQLSFIAIIVASLRSWRKHIFVFLS